MSALDGPESLNHETLVRIGQWAAALTPRLIETFQTFWGLPVRLKWTAATANPLYFWRRDEFYVTQAGETTLLRLSDNLCAMLLSNVLGNGESDPTVHFELGHLTQLESAMLTAFNSDLLQTILKRGDKSAKAPKSGDTVHLVWLIQVEKPAKSPETETPEPDFSTGKLILSIPASMLRLPPSKETGPIPDEELLEAGTIAQLYVGKSMVPMADLQGLEIGDTVVLDDSHKDRMALVGPNGTHFPFGISIANAGDIDVTEDVADELTQDDTMSDNAIMSPESKQALWDSLMIDVSASFDPIKMPLANIKQMSEGLIVEVGDIVHNQMTLMVDGKPLAKGELVIVGDHFGLRVTGLLVNGGAPSEAPVPVMQPSRAAAPAKQEAPAQAPAQPAAPQQPAPQPAAPPQQQAQAEPKKEDDFLDDDFGDDDDW